MATLTIRQTAQDMADALRVFIQNPDKEGLRHKVNFALLQYELAKLSDLRQEKLTQLLQNHFPIESVVRDMNAAPEEEIFKFAHVLRSKDGYWSVNTSKTPRVEKIRGWVLQVTFDLDTGAKVTV